MKLSIQIKFFVIMNLNGRDDVLIFVLYRNLS